MELPYVLRFLAHELASLNVGIRLETSEAK
jgi:hypothetical protein